MDIHHLHIFAAVYKYKNFTKAAQQINISQPTVSEHIKNLENELDCRLFDRIGKSIEPTSSAKKLFPKALKILDDVSQLKSELLGGDTAVKGEVILGASTIPSTYLIPQYIKEFRQKYPHIFFQVKIEDSRNINRLIIENELFCGIVGAKLDGNALQYTPFFKDELCLVASPGLVRKKEVTLDELSELPFIQREQGSGTRKAMEENLDRLGFTVNKKQIAAQFSSTAAVKEAAKSGLGVAVISRLAVREELNSKTLHVISLQKEPMERYFYLVHHKNRTLPGPYRKFCQFLEEVALGSSF